MGLTVDDKTLLRKNILANSSIWRLLTCQRSSHCFHPHIKPPQNNEGCSFYNFVMSKYSEGDPFLEGKLKGIEKIEILSPVFSLVIL